MQIDPCVFVQGCSKSVAESLLRTQAIQLNKTCLSPHPGNNNPNVYDSAAPHTAEGKGDIVFIALNKNEKEDLESENSSLFKINFSTS